MRFDHYRVLTEMTEESKEYAPTDPPEAVNQLIQGQAQAETPAHALRVLLVEDNQDHQRLMLLMLQRLGVYVVVAQNGQDGFEAVLRGEPAQLILMDLHMPRFDGYGATEQIRLVDKKNGHARRAILAVTAYTDSDERKHCLAVGMDDVLLKPVSFEKLKSVLAQWLPQNKHADTSQASSL
jgi:CheY-like chemotaxis protein